MNYKTDIVILCVINTEVVTLCTKGLCTCYIAGDQEDERIKECVMNGDY